MHIINPVDNLSPIYLPDPINRSHPLMRGRIASWMVIPGLDGANKWYDLVDANHMTFSATGLPTRVWSKNASPGGFGSIDVGATTAVPGTSVGPKYVGPPISFMAWIRASSIGNYQWIITETHQDNGGFGLGGATGSQLAYVWEGGEYNFASGLIPVVNEWTLVALTVISTSATIYMVNSSGIASATNTASNFPKTPTGYTLATNAQGISQIWKGQFDDISIYNRVLSASEIWQYYCLSRAGYAGLLNRWPSRSINVVSSIVNAVAAIIGAAAVNATGTAIVLATSQMVGVSSVAAAAAAIVTGSAYMTGVGILTPAGLVISQATAQMAGIGSLGAAGTVITPAQAGMIGVATLGANGGVTVVGTAALVGDSLLTATSGTVVSGSAHLAGVCLLHAGTQRAHVPLIIITPGASGDPYTLSGGIA
jgi:hypothetical protein